MIFFNFLDFKEWKLDLEKQDLAFFSKRRLRENKVYYECHRSGSIQTKGTGQKLKWAPTNKIGKTCPARIITSEVGHKIKVNFQRTHVGHTQSIMFLRFTKEERDSLAGQIKLGVPFDRILDDIRESVASKKTMSRIDLVERRDLHNITRDYNLDKDIADKNDSFSTEMWVKEQMSLKDDSPVLYFKMQGCEDGGPLAADDFMIVIMTPYQREVIANYSNDNVCVDSTHKTTGYDFQLTTQLSVDEFGAGCPVAFCLSNRVDCVAMEQFFGSVKSKVGVIKTNVFMSDDALAYVNAWSAVMSKPENVLICNWHVDKNWKTNLNKIKSSVKQAEVYKACRTLMEMMDKDAFHQSLEGFLQMCKEDPETKDFGEYFASHYANRPEKWAFCYRKGLFLNTNMFLEAINKKLKYCYMNGLQNRRVDKCIGLLMRLARDMMFERMIRLMKHKPTYRMDQIRRSHHQSTNIQGNMIKIVDEETWCVESATVGRGPYTVSINTSNDCSGCPLSCPVCQVCVHKFTCTCVDYQIKGNLCKHIHACMCTSNNNSLSIAKTEEEKALEFEEHNNKIISVSEGQSVHIGNVVSLSSRFTTLLNILSGVGSSTTNEGLADMIPLLEKAVSIGRQNKIDEAPSNPHLPKLPANTPSHKNVEKQRDFFSKRKKPATHVSRYSKPTDIQKISLQTTMDNYTTSSEAVSEVIHNEFDHSYSIDSSKCKKRKL